jgi:acyl-CoA thioesterase-2
VSDLWKDLLHCLKLENGDRPLHFRGPNQQLDYHRVFGGQLLGQAIEAARTAFPDKSVKSLHTVFPREGRADEPVDIEVAAHHQGRSFATLTVTIRQSRGVLAVASASMHAVEDGPAHQDVEPVPAVPGPEHATDLSLIPWETRSKVDLNDTAAGPATYEFWMRTPPVDPDLAPALAAYATDLTLIGTAVRPLGGLSHRGNGTQFTSAVTSHTVWFHRPFRTDEWLLLRQHSPVLAHGRCFGRGDLLTTDGVLAASYTQEALLRIAS